MEKDRARREMCRGTSYNHHHLKEMHQKSNVDDVWLYS